MAGADAIACANVTAGMARAAREGIISSAIGSGESAALLGASTRRARHTGFCAVDTTQAIGIDQTRAAETVGVRLLTRTAHAGHILHKTAICTSITTTGADTSRGGKLFVVGPFSRE